MVEEGFSQERDQKMKMKESLERGKVNLVALTVEAAKEVKITIVTANAIQNEASSTSFPEISNTSWREFALMMIGCVVERGEGGGDGEDIRRIK